MSELVQDLPTIEVSVKTKLKDLPFNITLLKPTAQLVARLKPVSVLDTFSGGGTSFHPEGLFSIEVFGRIGSEARDQTFSYVDLKVPIFHPEIFNNLIKLKSLYGGILSGKQYAIWNPETKDFVAAENQKGETGFAFFVKYWEQIQFKQTGSTERDLRIKLVEKYKKDALFDKHLVMPAGLRDLEIKPNGQTSEDEINDLYRRLITISKTITVLDESISSNTLNGPRWALQRVAVEIYQMIKTMISGKRGWFQGKWGSRKTILGTRNVISAMDASFDFVESTYALDVTDAYIGFAQTMRGALPVTLFALKQGWLGEVFYENAEAVWLVNPTTLRPELVELTPDIIDQYATRPGLERLINRFFERSNRNRPIIINGHYLGLLYIDDKQFKVFNDISQLPSHLDKANVHPLTLADLLFISTYRHYRKISGLITRYPVTGAGSTFPVFFKVRTTTDASAKQELGADWESLGKDYFTHSFPDRAPNAVWLDSLSPHSTRLGLLGADFDGDTSSCPFTLSNDAYYETVEYFKKRKAYVGVDGSLTVSAAVLTTELVIANMTGDA